MQQILTSSDGLPKRNQAISLIDTKLNVKRGKFTDLNYKLLGVSMLCQELPIRILEKEAAIMTKYF